MNANDQKIQDSFDNLLDVLAERMAHSRIRSILITEVEKAKFIHKGSSE